MLTGRHIREARRLLRWDRGQLSRSASLTQTSVLAAESSDGAAWLTDEQEANIRRACGEAGVEFTPDGPRLRPGQP